ncbi:adenylate cyclase type 10-like isoform X1 [Clarias magur]|uniref:Adenylate cyclase type 10-like isoform X1 n=1 Tax=Clarias magur TaxID=1594786 RepID=A0A8J4WR65_CLAMG|nr:adenylate cyclase type 10-like isoform X1 [Clarias magur]
MKLAAFLGRTFSTEMLLNILPHPLQESFNNILMILFKQGVFKCASPQTNFSGAKMDKSVLICYCESNSADGLASVAGVWKCELMCFCNEKVMEVAYQQIWSKQKQQLHKMCAKFLEKKAYRCNKCASKANRTLDKNEIYFTTGLSKYREEFLAKVDSILKEVRAGCRCECARLLETVLIPIVEHYKAAEDASCTFHYLLECATVCASLSEKLRAMQYLKEAKIILKNLKEGKPTFESEDPKSVYICELDRAVMYRLTGEILFNAGNILKAKKNFNESLKLLKCNFPSNGVAGSLKAIYEKIQKFTYRSRKYDMAEEKKLKYLHEQIACLSFLWQIHLMYGQSKSESQAIKMQSDLATQSTDGFEMILNSTDVVHHSQFVNKNACKHLEPWLYRTCSRLPDCAETRKLIGYVLRTLAMVQLCSGNLNQSIDFTLRADELGGLGLDARAIGILHLPLLLTGRYKESMKLIKKLETVGKEMSSTVADGWFYAGCLNFLLYTGLKVRPFEECLAFVYSCESDANMVTDKSLMMHLYSSLALWYARRKRWEKFSVFYDKAFETCKQLPASIHSLSGMAAFLECCVLLFKKELANLCQDWKKIYKRTVQLFEDFRNHFGGAHIFIPHVLHLNAFLYQLVGKNFQRNIFLQDALELYKNQRSLFDHGQIKQSQVK